MWADICCGYATPQKHSWSGGTTSGRRAGPSYADYALAQSDVADPNETSFEISARGAPPLVGKLGATLIFSVIRSCLLVSSFSTSSSFSLKTN